MAWNRDELRGSAPEKEPWEQLAPGVMRRRLPGWDATVGAVRGTSGVLVVDTGASPAQGEEVRDGLRRVLGLPVTHAVLTHSHFDHVFGTSAFGGARVYGAQGLGAHLAGAREELRRDAVAHGTADGTAAESAALLVPPAHEVAEQLTLAEAEAGPERFGECRVRLVDAGAAHSGFDLAVIVDVPGARSGEDPGEGPGEGRARRVVFCGDLVEESGEPQAGSDASPANWPGALDRLLALGGEDALYVPGHGAVVGAGFVRAQRDALARRFGKS